MNMNVIVLVIKNKNFSQCGASLELSLLPHLFKGSIGRGGMNLLRMVVIYDIGKEPWPVFNL